MTPRGMDSSVHPADRFLTTMHAYLDGGVCQSMRPEEIRGLIDRLLLEYRKRRGRKPYSFARYHVVTRRK